jgi:hypothetical protein
MGFFKFGKQHKQEPSEFQNIQAPIEKEVLPIPQVIPQEVKENKSIFTPQPGKKKNDISDLFRINIYDIFKYAPKLVETITLQGETAEKYSVKLPNPELGTFDKADIIKYPNGAYDLIFAGNINEISKELKEFVDFCVSKYGKDFMNKEGIVRQDHCDLVLGVFSRVWHNKLRIENVNFTISLSMYHIVKE